MSFEFVFEYTNNSCFEQFIEKRRRDRINCSLTELRRLVPAAFEKQVCMILSIIFMRNIYTDIYLFEQLQKNVIL